MTLELLFRELLAQERMPVSYATFCRRVQEQRERGDVVMHQSYEPGEYWLIDYSGLTVPIWNARVDTIECKAEVFVGVLGASGKLFCEATPSQAIEHFLGSHVRGFEYYGGVPRATIPDNLKSGIKKANWHEPALTRAYQELAAHYDVAVLPTRVRSPRDKAKVERAVLEIQRWILAPLRNTKFTTVEALNAAMRPLLDKLNRHYMRDYGASRQELFEREEQAALRPLPSSPFEVAQCKLARVNIDYHIDFELHRYSVPFQYVHQEVWVRASEHRVTVHCGGSCIASHVRTRTPYKFTTVIEHMPPAHQAMRARTTVNFLAWADRVGPGARTFVDKLLGAVRHQQQAYRTILGLQRLEKKFSAAALNAAAAEAARVGALSCSSVKALIARQILVPAAAPEVRPTQHANLRDPKLYH